jgi:hypothetical protein
MNQFFICNRAEIDFKLKCLIKTGMSEDCRIEYYINTITNDQWSLKHYETDYNDDGVSVLIRLPEPTIKELIDIAATSTIKNNIIGASLELWARENNSQEDFREALLNRLLQIITQNLVKFEKERLEIIIYESGLYDATNKKDIIGKHYSEIQKDADYYQQIAIKAKHILFNI